MSIRKLLFVAFFLLCATEAPAFAQPVQMRVNFTLTAPMELKGGSGVVLPPGKYVLFQFSNSDRRLFALYHNDMTHSPIAILRTVRLDYIAELLAGKRRFLVETDAASERPYPSLHGWNVPGDDGFEIVSVSVKRRAAKAPPAEQPGPRTGAGQQETP